MAQCVIFCGLQRRLSTDSDSDDQYNMVIDLKEDGVKQKGTRSNVVRHQKLGMLRQEGEGRGFIWKRKGVPRERV